jgi:RNA polymerase sigma-70 factor (ECF subfamily)
MTSNRDDTDDLLQEIFAKAFRSIQGFRGRSLFSTWLHSIAINLTINFLRKRGRRYTVSLNDVDAGIERDKEFIELTATSNPVRENELKELQHRLAHAMQQLSEDHRLVVTLHDVQGVSHVEIAKMLGISEGTVRSRLFYAHQRLQGLLSDLQKP